MFVSIILQKIKNRILLKEILLAIDIEVLINSCAKWIKLLDILSEDRNLIMDLILVPMMTVPRI
jgi:hypothetical protein